MPRRPDVPCAACGKLLWRGTGSTDTPKCQPCRKAAKAALPPKVKKPGTSGNPLPIGAPLTCSHCGSDFFRSSRIQHLKDARKGGRSYCSVACQNEGMVTSYRKRLKKSERRSPIHFPNCLQCHEQFTARNGNIRYCSDYCRMARNSERAGLRIKDLYREACRMGIKGKFWRKLLKDALRERDGDSCCLCWEPIDFTVKSGTLGSDNGYSIEHLECRSVTSDDSFDNLALSHWGCNRKRNTTPLEHVWALE